MGCGLDSLVEVGDCCSKSMDGWWYELEEWITVITLAQAIVIFWRFPVLG